MNTTIYQNATSLPTPDRCVLPMLHGIPIIIINFTLVFVGTFGNFLIIFAVLNTPKLRHRISNFLLLSLAAADLFVTMLAQPLHATSVTFTTFRHYCIPEIDLAYDIAGNFSVFCSLFHLASISIDRALVVAKPHQHHAIMTSYGLKLLLCICWGSAIIFTPFRVKFSSASMMSIGLVVFNFVIIIVSYAVILNQITRTKVISNDPAASASSSASRDARMERRVAGDYRHHHPVLFHLLVPSSWFLHKCWQCCYQRTRWGDLHVDPYSRSLQLFDELYRLQLSHRTFQSCIHEDH